jgi:hypothetical protein
MCVNIYSLLCFCTYMDGKVLPRRDKKRRRDMYFSYLIAICRDHGSSWSGCEIADGTMQRMSETHNGNVCGGRCRLARMAGAYWICYGSSEVAVCRTVVPLCGIRSAFRCGKKGRPDSHETIEIKDEASSSLIYSAWLGTLTGGTGAKSCSLR